MECGSDPRRFLQYSSSMHLVIDPLLSRLPASPQLWKRSAPLPPLGWQAVHVFARESVRIVTPDASSPVPAG